MTTSRLLLFGLFLLALVASTAAVQSDHYENGLDQALRETPADQTLPLLIVFEGALDTRIMQQQVRDLPLPERRRVVVSSLQENLRKQGGLVLDWLRSEVAAGRADHLYPFWLGNGVVVDLRSDRIQELGKFSSIARIRYDRRYPFAMTIDDLGNPQGEDPVLPTDIISWGVTRVGAPELWNQGLTGEGGLIAMIDSGVQWSHPDLIDHIWNNLGEIEGNGVDDDGNGYIDDVHGWSFFRESGNVDDNQGHGTKTAGIAVGDGTNGDTTGVAPDATFMVLQNYDAAGQWSSEATHYVAVQYALANGADVVSSSMSYVRDEQGGWIPDYLTARYTMEMSLAAGLIQANSTGNDGGSIGVPWNINCPANCPPPFLHPDQTLVGGVSSILACGMVRSSGVIHSSSDRGVSAWEDPEYPEAFQDYPWNEGELLGLLKPDLVGPSSVPTTTLNGNYISSFAGTSASTPNLGGSLVLLRSIHQQATPEEIAEALSMTAIDAGPVGFDTAYGAGEYRVNLAHDYLDNMFEYGGLHFDISTEDGNEPENLRVFIGDGEVEASLDSADDVVGRIQAGSYDIRVTATGYDFAEAASVNVVADDTLQLTLELPLTQPFISPEFVDESWEVNQDYVLHFDIANPYIAEQEYALSLEPTTLLDWETDQHYALENELGSIVEQALTWFNGELIVGGQRESTARFWRFEQGVQAITLIDSLDLTAPFDLYGVRSLCGVADSLYVAKGNEFVYLMDTTFALVDSIDMSGVTEFVRAVTVDPTTGHLYISQTSGHTVYKVDRQGSLIGQHSLDYTIIGLSYYEDFNRGPSLLVVDNSQGGRGVLKSYVLDSGSEQTEAYLSTPEQFNSVYGIAVHPDSARGIYQVATLARDTGIDIRDREVWSDLYDLPEMVTVMPGGGSVDVTLHTTPLPDSGSYNFRLEFTNLTDNWQSYIPVSFTLWVNDLDERQGSTLPESFALHAPWPNPFNPSVHLAFDLPRSGEVSLRIVNLLGQTVATLIDGQLRAGRHTLQWHGANAASGLYLAVLQAGSEHQVQKLMLLK
ncbi:S8 family serine peptidase [bacterium]|nr:S8 family serine peptidase [bacterium]